MIDVSGLPGGGGLLLSVAAYVGLSFLAGQEIADREIQNIGWKQACKYELRSEIESRRKKPSIVPEVRCDETVGWLGQDFKTLCHQFGNPDFNGPARRQEEAFNRAQQEREDRRLGRLARAAGTQCGCAEEVFKSDNAVSLTLYAGSARLITPQEINNLKQSLKISLGTPQCQAIAEAAK